MRSEFHFTAGCQAAGVEPRSYFTSIRPFIAFPCTSQKYGKLPLATSLAPAIRLAREGFPLYARLRGGMEFKKNAFLKTPDAARTFLVNGEVPPLGHIIRQPELAATFELLAKQGADGLMKRLAEIKNAEHLRALANAQHLAVDAAIAKPDALRRAIVAAAEQRLADRKAAAS